MRNDSLTVSPARSGCHDMLAACAVGPNYQAPETKAAEKFDHVEATYSTDPFTGSGGAVLADLR